MEEQAKKTITIPELEDILSMRLRNPCVFYAVDAPVELVSRAIQSLATSENYSVVRISDSPIQYEIRICGRVFLSDVKKLFDGTGQAGFSLRHKVEDSAIRGEELTVLANTYRKLYNSILIQMYKLKQKEGAASKATE